MIVIRIKIQIRKIGFYLMNDFGVQLVLKQKRAESIQPFSVQFIIVSF